MSIGAPTVRSLDARVDDLEKEFREFMAEMRLVITFLKWMGGFSAATFLSLIIFLFSISFSAGQLQQKVDNQTTAMGKLEDKVGKLEQKVDAQAIAVARMQEKIEAQTTALQELKQAIQTLSKRLNCTGDIPMGSDNPTDRSLNPREEHLREEFRECMAEMRRAVNFFWWLRAFLAAAFLTVVAQLFWFLMTHFAGSFR